MCLCVYIHTSTSICIHRHNTCQSSEQNFCIFALSSSFIVISSCPSCPLIQPSAPHRNIAEKTSMILMLQHTQCSPSFPYADYKYTQTCRHADTNTYARAAYNQSTPPTHSASPHSTCHLPHPLTLLLAFHFPPSPGALLPPFPSMTWHRLFGPSSLDPPSSVSLYRIIQPSSLISALIV